MSRIISAATALLITIILTITGFIYNTKTANMVSDGIYEAMKFSESNKVNEAGKKMKDVRKMWDERNKIMLVFTAHDKLDNIDESINIAEAYLENDELKMFHAECHRTLTLLDHFREIEYPSVNNNFKKSRKGTSCFQGVPIFR